MNFLKNTYFLVTLVPLLLNGQEGHTGHHRHADSNSVTEHFQHGEIPMSHAFSRHLPMTRNGSGTAWLPDSTPMYGYMLHAKKWMFMLHGNVFARYTRTDVFSAGSRGAEKADVVNWFMGMGQRKAGRRGLFRFSAMLSLDNVFGGNGYPLLFQTGETWQQRPLVDRQHPHDLVSELSVGYTHALSQKADLFFYLGYPGEPALGSVAFMHRVSSLYGPDAPLSHHWNDGTHITFGVATAGIRLGKFKLDVSNFTGREPDENRNDFDNPRFDSYSARLSFNPNAYWALQVSQGFIREPEAIRPGEDVHRTTASAIYSRPLQRDRFLNVTTLWGLNKSHASENAFLLEAAYVHGRWSLYGRYEFVQKSVEELALEPSAYEHDALFNVNALSVGFGRDLVRSSAMRLAFGMQGSVYASDPRLHDLYGKTPVSAQVFIRIYPPQML